MSDSPTPQTAPASSAPSTPERPNVDATMQTLFASDPTAIDRRLK